jgi:hypothetical protein
MPIVIRDVEFIDYAPGVAGVALGVRFEQDEVEHEQLLRGLLEVGMVVTIQDVSASGSSASG